MRMRTLGGTGIKVSPYCLGAMMFGAWGNPDHEESIRIIHAALDSGINFIDTADVYSAGEPEEIVGKALVSRRDDVVLATKAHGAMGEDVNNPRYRHCLRSLCTLDRETLPSFSSVTLSGKQLAPSFPKDATVVTNPISSYLFLTLVCHFRQTQYCHFA